MVQLIIAAISVANINGKIPNVTVFVLVGLMRAVDIVHVNGIKWARQEPAHQVNVRRSFSVCVGHHAAGIGAMRVVV
jgi:hypothetical protein